MNTIIGVVPHVSRGGFTGISDSYPSFPGYTRTVSLEIDATTFEWNCEMVVVSRNLCGIDAGQLYRNNHFE